MLAAILMRLQASMHGNGHTEDSRRKALVYGSTDVRYSENDLKPSTDVGVYMEGSRSEGKWVDGERGW